MSIQEKIKALFEVNDVPYRKVAEDLNIHRNTISSWCEKVYPRVDDLMKLAKYFNTPMSYFFDEEHVSNNFSVSGRHINALQNGDMNINSGNDAQVIKQLKDLIDTKNRLIDEKERVIQLLMKQLEMKDSGPNRDSVDEKNEKC